LLQLACRWRYKEIMDQRMTKIMDQRTTIEVNFLCRV